MEVLFTHVYKQMSLLSPAYLPTYIPSFNGYFSGKPGWISHFPSYFFLHLF